MRICSPVEKVPRLCVSAPLSVLKLVCPFFCPEPAPARMQGRKYKKEELRVTVGNQRKREIRMRGGRMAMWIMSGEDIV